MSQQAASYRKLSDDQLLKLFSNMVLLERKHAAEIIAVIHEIDSRRLYLQTRHASLFAFLTEEYGYTPGSAQRRIDAARLLGEIPEVKDSIRTGELNLMQVSALARTVHEKDKQTKAEIVIDESAQFALPVVSVPPFARCSTLHQR
jgi:hypothetical protein